MTTVKIGDRVRVNAEKVEVSPLNFIYEGQEGIVLDETAPMYAKVKFNWKVVWVDMQYLDKIND